MCIRDRLNDETMPYGITKDYPKYEVRGFMLDVARKPISLETLQDICLLYTSSRIEGNDEEMKDRFAVALKFGTAGLRGVLGAGTNRMNIYVVRQATQGLANWVKTQGGTQTVACLLYTSRCV